MKDAIRITKQLTLACVAMSLAVGVVHADPNAPQISGTTIQNHTTVAGVKTEGVQGSSSGGRGGLDLGIFKIGGGGGTARAALSASTVIGGVDVNEGTLRNSKVLNSTTASGVLNRGSALGVGYVRIGK